MDKRSTRKAPRLAISAVSLLTIGAMSLPVVHASSFNMTKKQIYFNDTLFSAPDGFVALDPSSNKPTTYLPIWYIQQLLQKALGINQTWDGHNWELTIPASFTLPAFTPVNPGQNASKRVVYLNNKAYECPTAIVTTDPANEQPTTYFPMWYIEQVMHLIGIQDTWDGANWRLTGANQSQSQTANATTTNVANTTNTTNDNQSAAVPAGLALPHVQFQNTAADDSAWWGRASNNYYIAAQTTNPLTNPDSSTGSRILNVQPGDTLYLFAYSGDTDVPNSETTWVVNSTDAYVTSDGQNWKVGNYQAAGASFVATKPGIYTIQANINGTYSVPLVITVGYGMLQSQSITTSAETQGIRPMSAGQKPVETHDNGSGTSYTVYAPLDNWIPISGKTTIGTKFVTVIFGGTIINPTWSYDIPVQSDGSFSAEVKSPVIGQIGMNLYTDYLHDLTALGNGQNMPESPVYFSVQLPADAVNLSLTDLDLMPTAKMNFNLNPVFAATADTLYENAPSVDSGIEAINNYVSDLLTYDKSEMQPNQYRFQDSVTTWNTKTGICEDYAELEASMLKSIGFRAETIMGAVPESSTGNDPANDPTSASSDNHEWLQIWDGAKWVIADPTWSSNDEPNTALVTNQFFTNTQSLQSTHTTDTSGIGTTFSGIYANK